MIVVLSAYKISLGQQTVSEFVTLITYFAQISAPLNFFGTFYTMIQNSLIEAERMLDLVGSRLPFSITQLNCSSSKRHPGW